MKICPRCHRQSLNDEEVMNSISHVGNRVMICNECGKQQGMVGMGYSRDLVEIEMEKRFKKELGL